MNKKKTEKPFLNFRTVSKDFWLQGDKTLKEVIPSLLSGGSWGKKFQALKSISFSVNEGEVLGIVGHNGAGKSTLMKLIAGVTYPTKGMITVRGTVAPLIELGAGFHYELSGYENIALNCAILGMSRAKTKAVRHDIIEFSEVKEFLHQPLKRYSTGMVMRLAFSIAVHSDASIYLIDEVLAVGDDAFQKKCLRKLQEIKNSQNKIILFISHDEGAVKSFCERALLIDHGKLITDDTPEVVFKKYHKLSRV